MASIYDWSTTAGDNSTADADINWQEGQAPSTVNNSARQLQARIAELLADITGTITAGGTANALTVTANSSFTTYANGRMVAFKAAADNTGATTLSVNAIGAKSVRKMGASGDIALVGGELQADGVYIAQYSTAADGGSGGWLLVNPTLASASSPITVQTFTASGTWTKPAGVRRIVIEAVGGGGGSGGVDGQGASTAGASGAGGSGFYGKTDPLDVTSVTSSTVTIGAAGVGGTAAGGNGGGNGGDTSITIGATTYTWGGGEGGSGVTAGEDNIVYAGQGGTGTNVVGGGWNGQYSIYDVSDIGVAHSGAGGSNPLGTGGVQQHAVSSSALAGTVGSGYGAGAGGALTYDTASDATGGAGTAGYMRIWEYY